MNLEGLALKLLLDESDKEKALEYYAELKAEYFSNAFATVLATIKDFYNKFNVIPSIEDLKVFRTRDAATIQSLSALELLKTDNIDFFFVVDELANQQAQNYTLDLIDGVLKTISITDRHDLLQHMATIPLKLEEKIKGSNKVHTPKTLSIFQSKEVVNRLPCGICNDWDAEAGGYYRQDLILLGGKRGSGKSVVCANLMHAQHVQGNPSVYYTIEMSAQEVYNRFLGIKAGLPASVVKQDTMSLEQRKQLCRAAADLFVRGEDLYLDTIHTNPSPDFQVFELALQRLDEKDKGRVIIYEDESLCMSTIDNNVATLKSKYGSDLFLVIVDYINRVKLDGATEHFDWKDQTMMAQMLKAMARRHDVCVVSPYQIDAEGKARFSQGILDAADVAQLIVVEDKETGIMMFDTVKARSADDTGKYRVGIDWKTLKIDPTPVASEEIVEKPSKTTEKSTDLDLL
jgi:KaiC/GvpD/RAD55 family RecA-like ATPase